MDDNKRKLYDALSQDYDLGSFEQFSNDIADETKRRKLYDAAVEEYDFGDFDTFSSQLGFGKAQETPAQPSTTPVEEAPLTEAPEDVSFEDEPDLRAVEQPRSAEMSRMMAEEGERLFKGTRQRKAELKAEQQPTSSLADAPASTRAYLGEQKAKRQQREADIERYSPGRQEDNTVYLNQTNDDILENARAGKGYSIDSAIRAGKEYENLSAEGSELQKLYEKYEKNGVSQSEYDAFVKRNNDYKSRMEGLLASPVGKEYSVLSDRYNALKNAESTPENNLEMARVAAMLSRNPIARAAMGADAPSSSQIDFDVNRAEVDFIESKMDGADRAQKKEFKAQLKQLNHEVLDNEYYQADVARRIEENAAEQEQVYARMNEIRDRVLKEKSKLETLDDALLAEPEYQQLKLASTQLEQTGRKLSHIRDKNASDFWVNFMDVFADPNTYTFNITNLETSLATKAASLHPEQDGSEELLSAVAGANAVSAEEGQFVEGKGKYGQIAAQSIPFMFQIGLTGGFAGVAKGISGAVGRVAGSNADKFIVRATGAVLGDLGAGFVAANTIGGGKTLSDIVNNYFGTLVSDGEGGFKYEGGQSLGRSVWGAEVGNTLEYASERAGDHMQHLLGRGILSWGIRSAQKNGRGSVNLAVEELAKTMDVTLKDFGFRSANQAGANWAQKAMGEFVKSLNKMGVQGLPFEVMEEYVGLLGNIVLGGEEKWMDFSKLGDKETHTDIWGGMLYSIGLTQAGTLALGGAGAAAAGIQKAKMYHQLENALESNSVIASRLLGEEQWKAIKENIDGTTNKDMPSRVTALMNDPNYDPRQRAAILDYVKNTYIYRGFNAGTIAQARERISSPENLLSLNINAEAASAQDQISDAYMLGYQQSTAKRADIDQMDLDRATRRSALDAIEQREEIERAVGRQKNRMQEITGIADMSEADASRLLADESQPQETRDAALDYLMALAVEQGFNDAEENRQLRAKAAIQADLEKKLGSAFYYEDEFGDKNVETTQWVNPSTKRPENIFILSGTPNESGEVPYVSISGRRGYVTREQIGEVDENGNVVPGLTKIQTLNDFLDAQYLYEQTQREAELAQQDAEQTAQREAVETQQTQGKSRKIVEDMEGEDGSFTYNGQNGRLIRKTDVGAIFEPEDGSDNVELTWAQLANGSAQPAPAQAPTPAPAPEQAPAAATEQAPAEEEAPKIPVDKNGNPVYDAPGVSVEDAIEAIYSTPGVSDEMGDQFIRDMAAEAEKGRNPKRGKMNLAEWGAATAEANRKAEFWKQMKEFADANTAEREKENAEQERRIADIEKYGVDTNTFDLTPQTIEEAVAEYLGNSEKLIDLDDAIRETLGRRKDNRVPRELFRHLGNGGILVKNGGRSVQDVAEDIVRDFYGDLAHDEEQDNARNLIIDMLLGKTKTEMRETIFNNRLEEARDAADMFSEEPAPVEEPAPAPVAEEPEPEPIPEPEPQPEPAPEPEAPVEEPAEEPVAEPEQPAAPVQAQPTTPEGFGAGNKIFTKDAKDKARETILRKLKGQLNAGIDPEMLTAMIQYCGYYIEAGVRAFTDFAKAAIADLGDAIRPYLKSMYNAVRDYPDMGEIAKEMTPYDEVAAIDVNAIGNEEAPVEEVSEQPAEKPEVKQETEIEKFARENFGDIVKLSFDDEVEARGIFYTIFKSKNGVPGRTRQIEDGFLEDSAMEYRVSSRYAKFMIDHGSHFTFIDGDTIYSLSYNDGNISVAKYYKGNLENPSESPGNSVTLEGEEEAREKFTDTVANRLIASIASGERPYKSITDLRKAAREAGMEVDERGATDILLQELTEVAIVRAARKFMSDFNEGLRSRNAFNAICKLYEMQPTISMRSSQRVSMQQYSTPLPMSFVAQMFAYQHPGQVGDVLEPTAGNGMLLFGIPAKKIHANELDATRKANLDKQGFKEVTQNDATEPFSGKYQAVVANPPFGSHDAVEFDGKKISGLDPVITLRALDAMDNNGRAAIIIGGNVEWGDNGGWKTKKAFFSYLYDHYNVKGVVNMAGDLYAKQGTSYPTMMILIDGKRSESDRTASTVYPPVRDKARGIATTNDELFDLVTEILNDKRKTDGNEVVRTERERKPADRSDQTGSLFAGDDSVESPSDGADGGRGENGGGGVQSPRRNDVAGENRQDETVEGRPDGERPGSVRDVPAEEPGEVAERSADSGGEGVPGTVPGGRAGTDGRGSEGAPVGDAQREQPESVPGGEPAVREPVRVARKIKDKILSYIHHSRARSLESVAPAAMVEDMDASIQKIEKELGRTIDDFVTEELGYNSTAELHKALAAEQIDSVAMAIYQMKQGKAMIIGDQTGVGKGRQVAALIRWANRQGKKPVFMTQKAGLFSDIYRDLRDIGSGDLNPLILNSATMETDKETGEKHWSDTSGVMLDEDGNVKYRSPKSGLDKIIESGKVPDEYDFVVLTYSQLNNGDQQSRSESKKKVKDGTNPKVFAKAAFVRQIVNDNYILLDESHTAAGEDSNSGAFLRSVMPSVKGVTFSSATFAKRPDTMPLYAIKSAMSEANVEPNKLIAMIKKGGVTLQEIMSRALTRSGQMVRRERDMSDVKTDWKTVDDPATAKKARANYDRAIEIFNKIIQFQRNFITPVIDDISRDLAEVASSAGETSGTKNFGVDNPPFVSQTYNFTKQLMLALKAEAIVDEVVKEIKAGRHPVIALENTYESGLDAYAVGDKIEDTSFSAGLLRSLGRILQYTVTDPDGEKSQEFLTPEELGPEAAKQYYALQDEIREATKGIFLSPLDLIKERLTGMGYNVGEVTGRKTHVVKEDDGYYRRERVADAKQAVRDFNSGASDVIIINKSGSTGISLHSSVAFKDQRPRSMIIAQPLGDINDYMQMIGRIDRTGQVHRGYYINLSLPVPAELRFNMMLASKLKSLNANTTTSQESDTGSVEAPDFLNKYGSQVVIEYLRDNPDVFSKLVETGMKLGGKQNAVTTSAELENYRAMDEDIQKVTGRIALLPVEEQEKFYADISERYNTLIKYLDETGENTLKITTLPLKAKTLARRVGTEGKAPGGDNPFAQNSYVERVEVDVLRKPMKADEIRKVRETLTGGKESGEYRDGLISRVNEQEKTRLAAEEERYNREKEKTQKEIDKQIAALEAKVKNMDEVTRKAEANRITNRLMANLEEKHQSNVASIKSMHRKLREKFEQFNTDDTYLVYEELEGGDLLEEGNAYSPALFCGFKTAKAGENLTPSTSVAVFATLDGRRRLEIKFTSDAILDEISNFTNKNYWAAKDTTIDNWDSSISNATREERYVLTGNILQAWDDATKEGVLPGRLVSYTDIDGNIHDGILMNQSWQPTQLRSSGAPINSRTEQILNGEAVRSTDGEVEIEHEWGDMFSIYVPKTKKAGAKYFENEDILSLIFRRQGFHQYRGRFTATVTRDNMRALLNILGDMGVRVNTEENESAWEEVGQETVDQQSQDEEGTYFRQLTDPDKIAELEAEEKVPVYRSALFVPDPNGNVEFDLLDGKGKQWGFLYPPMSVKVDGKFRAPLVPGTYDEAEERPDLATDDGYFWLVDDNGDKMKVAYAPYLHNRVTPLNEQFAAAYKRNLVVIRSLVPKSELTSGYSAEKSRKATGMHDWPSGTVSNALAKEGKDTRKVILSRWAKIGEPVPYDQVADEIVDLIGDRDLAFEYNVVSPGLRKELMKRGVRFEGWHGNRPKNADSLIASMQPQFNRSGENLSSPIDRARAITTIDGIAKKLGVEFEQDSSLKAKGAFNPKTGKIRINIDAHKDTADLEATLLHEAVAHYGLRKLFGKDWRELRKQLYEQAAPEIKAKVDAIAKADGLSTEVAMEEYIAQLAEDGRFDVQEESFWQRIVTALKRLLAKIGINAGYLTDEDFRAMLYASYRNLQTGGALETAARVGVYQALRRNADASHEDNGPEDDGPSGNFRRWFGDSKVVDENGRPLVVYHGSRSTRDFSVFDYDADTDKATGSGEKPAFFFSDEDTAGVYKADVKLGTLYEGEGRMVPAYLSIQNPAEIDYEGANFRGVGLLAERYNYLTKQWEPFTNNGLRYFPNEREIISALRKRFPNRTFDIDVDYRFTKVDAKPPISEFVDGINRDEYDGAIIRNIDEVGKVTTDYVVFNSNQIKSAFGNNGEYSAEDPDIYHRNIPDLPEDVKQLAIEQETGELYRRSRNQATAQTAAQMYGNKVRTVGSAVKEVLVDEMAPVDALMDALATESKTKLKDDERVSDMMRETGGKAMQTIREYDEKFLKPMWTAVGEFRKKAGVSIKDTETYIGLKSGLERNVVLAKRDAKHDYQAEYDAEIEEINQEEKSKKKLLDQQLKNGKISDVTYQGELTVLQQEMQQKRDAAAASRDTHFADIDAGTDARFKEYRKKDYSAITAWANTDDIQEAERLASDYVSDMEGRVGAGTVKEMWKRINAATKETLRFQYENQMLSRQQYQDISKMMEYYVPMRGFSEDTAEDLFNYYVTAQSNDFQATVLSAKGRKTWYEGPLGNIGAMHSSAISQGVKNSAKLSLLDAVRRRPNNTIATVTRAWFVKNGQTDMNGKDLYDVAYPQIPENATFAQRQAIIDRFEEEMKQKKEAGDAYNSHREVDLHGGVVAFERQAHKNEHIVTVREGGKEYGIIINGNPSAAQAINGVRRGNGAGEKFLDILRGFTRVLSSMFTTFSVPFWVSNFQRDHGQGLTNTFIRNNREYVGRYIINRMKAVKLFPLILGKETMDKAIAKGDPVAKLYQQYLENGGPMGQNRIEDNEYFERQMKRYLDNSVKQGVIKGVISALNVIGGVGEAIETITRFAVFMTSMESGRPLHQSISDAKEVSTNFARKGSGRSFSRDELDRMTHADGTKLNAVEKGFVSALSIGVEICRATIPFFNAAVQGLENKVTNYREHTGKTLLADSIYLLLGFGMKMLLGNVGGDDDKEKYSHTSDYLRRNNILNPLGDGVYAKWALPQEYRVMYALGDIIASAFQKERPAEDLGMDFFGALMQLSPIGAVTDEVVFSAENKKKAYETLITNVSPGVIAPVMESIFNMDFKGARIYNEGFNENLRAYPGWTKALPTTGKEYVAAAKFLNELTGGNDVERGWININPAIVEHLVESYFSGPYQIVVRIPEAVVKGVKREAKTRDIPLWNRLILNTNDNQRDAYYSNMYYYFKEKNTEAARIHSEYSGRKKEGQVADFYKSDEYKYFLVFKKYEKAERELRKASKMMDEKVNKEKKQKYDERLQDIQYRIAKECLDIYFDRNGVK